MRQKERIPIYIKLIKWQKLISALGGRDIPLSDKDTKNINDYWLANYDQRLGQMLINIGYIPDGMAWYYECQELLIHQGYEPKDFLIWGINFDKDMNKLPETQWKLCTDLSTDHINAILDGGFTKNSYYIEIFGEILKDREGEKKR